jgi:hypothetical protein
VSEIIKKVTVPQNELPPIGKITGQYIVRYRIISEDRNRSSHWSLNYILETDPLSEIQHTVSKDNANDAVEVFWNPPPTLGLSTFDVYIKWGSGPWNYAITISTTSYKASILNGATSVQVAVQAPTKNKVRSDSATLFESDPLSL